MSEALEGRRLLSADAASLLFPASDINVAHASGHTTPGMAYTQYQVYNPAVPIVAPFVGAQSPAQLRKSYGIDSIDFGGVIGDGTGQTIAIVDAYDNPAMVDSTDANFLNSDLHKFDQMFNLPDPVFTKVDQNGGTNYPTAVINDSVQAGWRGEIALDVEWAHAVAPGAKILLVEANSPSNADLYAAVDFARRQPGVVAVSMSFGGDEFSTDPADNATFATPAGHTGITFLASTGDSGAPGSFPAYSPGVVAVGGTTLIQTDATGTYQTEVGWTLGGGGVSQFQAKPAYQSLFDTPGGSFRTTPDVSLDADPATGVTVYDSTQPPDPFTNQPTGPLFQIGGTSLSTPVWAGLVAIADQGRSLLGLTPLDGASQTLPRIYSIDQGDYNDVTSGFNGATDFGFGFAFPRITPPGTPSGYAAGPGYDLVTGRGTPIAADLVPALAGGVTVTGTVFNDANRNGIRDGGDAGISGVTVFLDLNNDGGQGAAEPSTVTAVDGSYSFADLPADAAYNAVVVLPTGQDATTDAAQSVSAGYGESLAADFGLAGHVLTAKPNGPYSVPEEGTVTLSGAGSLGVITAFEWDTNYDGVTFHPVLTGRSPTFNAAGLDGPTTRTIALRVTDATGATSIVTTPLTISNAPPTVAIVSTPGGLAIDGQPVTYVASATDVSAADRGAGLTLNWTVTSGGSTVATGTGQLFSFTPSGQRPSYTVSVVARDKDGGASTAASSTLDVVVTPTATFSNGGAVGEGAAGQVSFTGQAGGGSFVYSYDFDNDGTFDLNDVTSSTVAVPAAFLADGPGARTVRARITNQAGSTDYTTTIAINNVAPTATFGGPAAAVPGGPATVVQFTGQADAAADLAAGLLYSYDFNNDGTFDVVNSTSPSAAVPGVLLTTLGTRTVRARIADKDGGFTDYVTTITVQALPVLTATGGTAVENTPVGGIPVTLTLSAPPTVPVTVNYATADGTAVAGQDYVAASGTVTFQAGETTKTVLVPLIDDGDIESTEAFSVTLSSVSGALLSTGTPATTVTQTIFDDDTAVTPSSDPSKAKKTVVRIDGSSLDDTIAVHKGKGDKIIVVVNGGAPQTFGGVSRLVVFGGAGNDRIIVDANVKSSAVLFGGDGDDVLTGGAGNDALVGGAGSDRLRGNGGKDVLIDSDLAGSQDTQLQEAQNALDAFAGKGKIAARVAAVQSLLQPITINDNTVDILSTAKTSYNGVFNGDLIVNAGRA